MPIEYGDFDNPKKSAYSLERYQGSWEREYMEKLENDIFVKKWTKMHGISIPYITEAGHQRPYKPDFLVENIDGSKELHEVKGGHLIQNEDWKRKRQSAENWCKSRGMKFVLISK
ncbi:MAG: Tn7 Tnp TnsA protein [Ignavibacteria bacterium]|nr:Tn7 Tnp TnsA protein [Ignavibacteria bacterium]